jgi:DNA-binding MarR family transcriptional regulator
MKTKQIYDHLERVSNLLRADSRRSVAEYGLQPIQLEALHYLSICNRYSDTPMATTEYLGQTKGTVSQTLKVLENKGLLVRHADSTDKRLVHLKVSRSGKKLLKESIPTPLLVNACEQLTEKSQSQILKALEVLLVTMQQTNNMKTFGVCHSCHYNQKIADNRFFCNLTEEALSVDDVQLICREHKGND